MEPDSDRNNFSEIRHADYSGDELLRLWKAGDEQAAGVLVDRYAFRLVALVAERMNQRFRGSIDPEDVVQSRRSQNQKRHLRSHESRQLLFANQLPIAPHPPASSSV